MKIIGIKGKLSGFGKTALITEPKITGEVFNQIKKISANSVVLGPLNFQMIEDCLVFQAPFINKELPRDIANLLVQAEIQAQEIQKFARNQAQLQESKEGEAVKTAAETFGVPIK